MNAITATAAMKMIRATNAKTCASSRAVANPIRRLTLSLSRYPLKFYGTNIRLPAFNMAMRYCLVIRLLPDRHGRPDAYRLKVLLKALLRALGIVVVELREQDREARSVAA